MVIRSLDSTISFSVVVKIPASHPSDPGSIPASVMFYNLFNQISCQNVDFHNRCDHKDISSKKKLYSGVGIVKSLFKSRQLRLRPIGFEKAKINRGFLPILRSY